MPTSYTTNLGLALPVTAELAGTWGDVVNNEITSLLDSAVAGTTTLSSDADVTLTTTTGAANQSRQAILLWTANGTATRTITAPARTKAYVVINATAGTQSIKLVGAGPTTGITIVAGEKCLAAWNGSDFVKVASTVVAASQITGTLGTANGGTGLTSFTANGVVYASSTSALTTGGALTFDGSTLTASASASVAGNFKSTSSAAQVFNLTASNDANTTIGLGVNGSAASAFGMVGTGQPFFGTSASDLNIYNSNASGVIKFGLGTSFSEQMRLTSTGLGIGTSSPGALLHVSNPSAKIRVGLTASDQYLDIYRDNSTGYTIYNAAQAATFRGHIWQLGGSSAMTLDSSGNLGLGMVPSASTTSLFQMYNSGVMAWTDNNVAITGNAVYNSAWKYIGTGNATMYKQNVGQHQWFTAPSGTAGNAISFTQAMTLDASGNFALGTTTTGANDRMRVEGSEARIRSRNSSSGAEMYIGAMNPNEARLWASTSTDLTFGTNNTERARIDASGNLLVGTTTSVGKVTVESTGLPFYARTTGAVSVATFRTGSDAGYGIAFENASGGVAGSIYWTDTTTTYATSSDARLKDNIAEADDVSSLIDAIRVRKFDWKTSGKHQRYGFVAQELLPIVHEAVSIPANDPAGLMGVDYSKLVPLLVKEIQSLRARVAQLETQGV